MNTKRQFAPFTMLCAVAALTACTGLDSQASQPSVDATIKQPAVTPPPAVVPQPVNANERAFLKLDVNADGAITPGEWQHFDTTVEAKEHFNALDENGDGIITAAEFLRQAPKYSQIFGLSLKPDGKTSSAELPELATLHAQLFQKLDLDTNGVVTVDEWKQFDTTADIKKHFDALDENGDRRINAAEFLTQAPKYTKRHLFFGDTNPTNQSEPPPHSEEYRLQGWQLFSVRF